MPRLRPQTDDPLSHLEPLAPGEAVLWAGAPDRLSLRRLASRHRVQVIAALGSFLVYAGWAWVVSQSGGLRYVTRDMGAALVTIVLGLSPLVHVAWITLALAAFRSRRYALTNRRGVVVDPIWAYTFPLALDEARVEDHALVLSSVEPSVVAEGSYPWTLPALRGRVERRAALEDLRDPAGVLAELRRSAAPR